MTETKVTGVILIKIREHDYRITKKQIVEHASESATLIWKPAR